MALGGFSPTDVNIERVHNAESAQVGTKYAKQVILLDTNGNEIVPSGPAGIVADGIKAVTTAGTAVRLSATSVPCRRVFIQALATNTKAIAIGASTVVAAEATARGASIFPTQGDWFNVDNLNLLYIDSQVNGEGVNYLVET